MLELLGSFLVMTLRQENRENANKDKVGKDELPNAVQCGMTRKCVGGIEGNRNRLWALRAKAAWAAPTSTRGCLNTVSVTRCPDE